MGSRRVFTTEMIYGEVGIFPPIGGICHTHGVTQALGQPIVTESPRPLVKRNGAIAARLVRGGVIIPLARSKAG